MKSVMLSIHPFYGYKIAVGEKLVEIRKRKPDLALPFKVYLYCTSVKRLTLVDYVTAFKRTGGAFDNWIGKVFAEFTCNDIIDIDTSVPSDNLKLKMPPFDTSFLTPNQIISYIGYGNTGYGWCISDVKVYDEPMDVTDFSYAGCINKLKRPPQSYCYVNGDEFELH